MTADAAPDATWQDWASELAAPKPARLVLPGTASEADWLAARRQGITASEIAIIMGLSSFSSPYKLYWQKTGDLPPDDQGDRLALGHVLEPWIAERFAERSGLFVTGDGRSLWAHGERPWQMATPDRFAWESRAVAASIKSSPLAVLECKSWGTFDEWGPDGSDEIPVPIRCQVLWQMDVMGVTTGYVACVFLPGAQLRVYELTMDDGARNDLALMLSTAERFLGRIAFGDPPEVDWRPATADALKRLHPSVQDIDVPISTQLAQRYQAACRNLKTAERKRDKYANQIRERLGSGHRAVDPGRAGLVIARRDVYDVKAHSRKASHVDKLVPVKPPKEARP